MIIIRLTDGFGNQMFQYALGYHLMKLGKEVKYDISSLSDPVGLRIDSFFDLDMPIANKKEVYKYFDIKPDPISKIRRKLCGINSSGVYFDEENGYQKEVFTIDDIGLSGYWQSEKYFSGVAAEIKKLYNPFDLFTDYQRHIMKEIDNTNSVSVHIRRGDYLKYSKIYGGICDDAYLEAAMQQFDDINPHFFIFSNDYEYVCKRYKGDKFTLVKPEENPPEVNMDMFLMSKCRNNIIANSSFSWWGAWLNDNSEKKIIAPSKWNNVKYGEDIYCDGWIKI